MVTIKDIYTRFDGPIKNMPPPPFDLNLTPLQLIEWKKQNPQVLKDYESFPVGRKLLSTPALISKIYADSIIARAVYHGSINDNLFPRETCVSDLEISFTLEFDEKLYETVKQFYNDSWIEFEGEILSFRYDTYVDSEGFPYRGYTFNVKLTGIKVISKPFLSPSSLLGYNKPSTTKCFIATAAYGNQYIAEVILLREFRDNVLINSFIGRTFISAYGVLSPPIAFVIRKSNWLRKVTRIFLSSVVLPFIITRANQE